MQTEYSKVSNLQRCEEFMQINCLGETGASCHKTEQSVTLISVIRLFTLITQMCLSSLAVAIKL